MARDDMRKIRDVRDALDGILKEIDGKKATIEQLSAKIKGLNAILAREVQVCAEAEGHVQVPMLVDDGYVAHVKEKLLRTAAQRLAEHLLVENLVTADWRTEGGGAPWGSVAYQVRLKLRLLRPPTAAETPETETPGDRRVEEEKNARESG